MGRAVFGVFLAFVAVLAGSAWWNAGLSGQSASKRPPIRVRSLQRGIPYAIDTPNEEAEIVIPVAANGRYTLIVGSLGDPHESFPVTIERLPAESVANPSRDSITFHPVKRMTVAPQGVEFAEFRPISNAESAAKPRESTAKHVYFLHTSAGQMDDPAQYEAVSTTELAQGPHIRVLLDEQIPTEQRHKATAAEIVRLFESEIRPKSLQVFGPHHDVDGDGRLTVVLTPRLRRMQSGKTSLDGLVVPGDYRPDLARPFSNHCDLLYLNSEVPVGFHLKALLVHEYTHVIGFSRRWSDRPNAPHEDDWITEGIAHIAEQIHESGQSNIRERLATFLRSPQDFPLVIPDYHAAGLWRNPGCRGATFSFHRWCVRMCGERILRNLIAGRAIGVAHIEQVTGIPFTTLFRQWSLSLYKSGAIHRVEVRSSKPNTLQIRGTAAAFVTFATDENTHGMRMIRIKSKPEARLQITLIRNAR